MPIGSQPTWAQLNANATIVVLNARAALQEITNFNAYLQAIGAAALEALASAAGDSTANADVTEMMAVFADLAEVATMCSGGPVPVDAPKNFVAQTVPLWNAQ